MNVELIPDLVSCLTILGFSLGFLFGEGGSNFDWEVKYSAGKEWYDKQGLVAQYLINYGLNLTHHFQYGLALIAASYIYTTGNTQLFVQYFGAGLLVSDWKDYKYILKRLGIGTTYEPPPEPIIPPVVNTSS